MEKKETICIVATDGKSLLNFRGELIRSWIKKGLNVVCISIEPVERMKDQIAGLGATYLQVKGSRTGISVFSCFSMIIEYRNIFAELQPKYVFLYMSKPIAFGSIAAILAKVPSINILINGLENAYYRKTPKDMLVRNVMSFFYRLASKYASNVFLQNKDDLELLISKKAIHTDHVSIVNGSGVDMNHFAKKELPKEPVILMIARLLWSKGIREFLEAITLVKQKYPDTRVLLVGGLDNNDEALSKDELEQYILSGMVEYCGFCDDVRPYIEQCSIFVLPSYHEGLPRSIVEAMSTGRAVITTDVPGCRETVVDGVNGFVVPARDGLALFKCIEKLIIDADLRREMAENSYTMCTEKFEVGIINDYINKAIFGGNENVTV